MKKATESVRVRHPGVLLYKDVMIPLGLSATQLAIQLRLSPTRITELLNERRRITVDTALRLAKLFGTTPHYWLNLQADFDIWQEQDALADELDAIRPLAVAQLDRLDPEVLSVTVLPPRKKQRLTKRLSASLQLPEDQKQLYDLLTEEPIHFDVLCQKTGLEPGKLQATLSMLEVENLIDRRFGDFFQRSVANTGDRVSSKRR